MTKDKALKLALEALEVAVGDDAHDYQKYLDAITAIKQALAAPVQGCDFCKHPLYAGTKCKNCWRESAPVQDMPKIGCVNHDCDRCKAAAPVQEPVAWMYEDMMGLVGVRVQKEKPIVARPVTPLYTTPPAAQRQWVGLTDEEAFQICVDCGCLSEDWLTLLDAIEAKLKEKNTWVGLTRWEIDAKLKEKNT